MRLIDADELKSMYSINRANFNTVVGIQKWIDNAPTVNAIPISVIEDIKAEIEDLRNKCMEQGGVFEHTAYGLDYATEIINKHIGKENTDADSY